MEVIVRNEKGTWAQVTPLDCKFPCWVSLALSEVQGDDTGQGRYLVEAWVEMVAKSAWWRLGPMNHLPKSKAAPAAAVAHTRGFMV